MQQLKRNDCVGIHIFINNFHVHQEGPPDPCNLDIQCLPGLIYTTHNYGFCGLLDNALQTNEHFHLFLMTSVYTEILNCPQSNHFVKMLLVHLYKFRNKRGFHLQQKSPGIEGPWHNQFLPILFYSVMNKTNLVKYALIFVFNLVNG